MARGGAGADHSSKTVAKGGQGQITAVRLWPGGAGADHSSKTVARGGRGRSQQ